ncbi:MAG: SIR2 family protein [Chitinophagales bacterium]|nr:SIR2 family protein [Chitinophagales bacterium]
MQIDKLKDVIQDCNINFLVGSGLSVPYFTTLANVELLLTDLSRNTNLDIKKKEIIRASILGKYFENVIKQNPSIIDDAIIETNKTKVLENYKTFLVNLNTIVLKRKSTILNKQVNLFTTNIDVFFEKALEETQLEYNDGFYGRFNPIFSLTNFKKSFFKKSLHYDNTSEIPVFNLLKVHGSLTWESKEDKILYSQLNSIALINSKWELIKSKVIDFTTTTTFAEFERDVIGMPHDSSITDFLNEFDTLTVVDPTKEKFHDTILNLYYYELLRVFSNEMEKENTILFIMGFSLSDEHIREIIVRAANSNPTLVIKILAYDAPSKGNIEENIKKCNSILRYNNIDILEPATGEYYDFEAINTKVFKELVDKID